LKDTLLLYTAGWVGVAAFGHLHRRLWENV